MRRTNTRDAGFIIVFAALILLFAVVSSHASDYVYDGYNTYDCDTLLVVSRGQEMVFEKQERYIIVSSVKKGSLTVYKTIDNNEVMTLPPYRIGHVLPRKR